MKDLLKNAMQEGRIADAEAIIKNMDKVEAWAFVLAIDNNKLGLLNLMLDKNPSQLVKNLALNHAIIQQAKGKEGALEAMQTLMAEGAKTTEEYLYKNESMDFNIAKLILPTLNEITPKTAEIIVKNPRILEAILIGEIEVTEHTRNSLIIPAPIAILLEAMLTGEMKVDQAKREALIAAAPAKLLVAIGERKPQLLEAMLTGKMKVDQAKQEALIAAAPAELLVAIGERNPQLLEAMLTGEMKVDQAKQEALIAAAPAGLLGKVIGMDVPSARSEKATVNNALVQEVLRGNVKEAQALILHGASADVVNKDGSKPGLKLADYMKYGAKRAAKEGKSYDEKGMEALIGAYDAVEKQFKDKFETKVLAAVKNLGPDPSVEKVAEVFNKALTDAYKPGFADKVKPMVTATIVEDCKLDFIDNFIIAFKSLVSKKTFDELRDMKLVDRMYKEVQHTRAFQEFASPEIGKAATLKSHVAGIEAEKARVPGVFS